MRAHHAPDVPHAQSYPKLSVDETVGPTAAVSPPSVTHMLTYTTGHRVYTHDDTGAKPGSIKRAQEAKDPLPYDVIGVNDIVEGRDLKWNGL